MITRKTLEAIGCGACLAGGFALGLGSGFIAPWGWGNPPPALEAPAAAPTAPVGLVLAEDPILTIRLTGRAPVRIVVADWPVIARASADNAGSGIPASRRAELLVRLHRDGRAIVHGSSSSRWQGEPDRHVGVLLARGADLPGAIARAATGLDWPDLAQRVVDALPAQELQ